jgi:excisionase family DNA binding protein
MKKQNQTDGTLSMLTPQQVAGELGISVGAVYNLIHAGTLPAVDLATKGRGCYRVKRQWLDEFLDRRRVPSVAPVRRREKKTVAVRDYLGL